MGGEVYGGSGLVQRKLMGNEATDVEFARKDQSRHFSLQVKIRGVAAYQIFFINTDRCQVHGGFCAALGMREHKHLTATTDGGKGIANDGVGGDGDDGGVEGTWSVEREA